MRKTIAALLALASSLFSDYAAKDYSHLLDMKPFSRSLLEMHFKLYEGYVKNANLLLAKIEQTDPASYEYGALKRRVGWEIDGIRLHELYFENLGGNGAPNLQSSLSLALIKQFGSFEKWKTDFIATGMMRGIGWSVLYYEPESGRLINQWINEHDVGHLAGGSPILIMDVFEHAYMPQFQLDKKKYIDAFFQNIDWNVAETRFKKASL